jgi:MalT-like TPR region
VASLMRDGGLSLACFERLVGHLDRGGELSAIARAGRFGGRVGVVGGAAVTVGRRVLHRRWREALALPSEADRYVRGLAYLGVVEAQVAILDAARDHIEQLEVFARARGRDAEAIGIVARAHWSFSMGRLDEVRALSRAGLAVLERKPGALDAENARRARSSLELIGAWADALTASPATRSFDPAAAIDEMFEMHMLMLPAVRHAARGEVRGLLEARALLFARCFRLRSGWQEAFIFAPTAPALMDAGLVAQLQDDVALLFDLDVPASPWRKIIRRTVPGMLLLAQGSCERAIELFDEAVSVVHGEASGSAMYVVHALQLAAEARVEAGRHDEAEPRLRDVIAIGEAPDTRHPPASIRARRILVRSALARGDVDGAERALDESGTALGRVDLPGERAAFLLLDAELSLARGDRTAAAGRARTAQEMFVKLGNPLGAERALALRRRSGDLVSSSQPGDVEASARPDAATVTMTSRGPVAQEPTDLDPGPPAQLSDPRRR